MQLPRICANCKYLVDPSLRYCPYCFEAVDPVLVAQLQWLHRTLLDLDQRIARGEAGTTIQQLHDSIAAEYAALVVDPSPAPVHPTDSAAPVALAAPVATALAGNAVAAPVAPPRTFSWSAFFTEQSIAIIAYIGAFLLLVATLTFEVGGWQALNDTARLMIVVVVYVLFGSAGFVLLPHAQHRTISQTYLSIFALMTPLLGLAIYQDALRYTTFPVVGVISAVAWYTTVVYLALALRTHITVYGYMSAIVLIIAAQYVLPWAGISEDWALFTLALSAIVLLIPEIVGTTHHLARPALVISLIASVILVLVLFIEGLLLVDSALTPSAQSIGINQGAFTVTAIIAVVLSSTWAFTARRQRRAPWVPVRQWADIITYWLVAFAIIAIAANMGISQASASYLLALLALTAGGVALLYLNVANERKLERRYIWTLALFLATWGYLINQYRTDPNVPIIVALLAVTAITCGIAMFESGSAYWWLVYGGVALTLVLHSLVAGSLGGVPLYDGSPQYTQVNLTLIWFHVAIAVAFWAVAMAFSWVTARQSAIQQAGVAMKHFSQPIYTVAAIDSGYATFSLFILFPDTPYRQLAQALVMGGFAALALITGRREREFVMSGIFVICYGILALLPYLVANGGYWQWCIPTFAVAGLALVIRARWGRASAIPLYIITAADSMYAAYALFTFVPDAPYRQIVQTLVIGGFAALALIIGRREREFFMSGLFVGSYGIVALFPYLSANGSFWQWVIPPLVAAGLALVVRAWLGLTTAIPFYAIAIVGMLLGQSRLTVDVAANQTGFLAISVSVWFMVLFGLLSIAAAVLERCSQITLVTAYCASAALIGTTNQVALYALTLLTLAGTVILQARYGRWWNIWLLTVGVVATYADISNYGDGDPGVFAWKLAFLAVTALFGYALLIGMRDEPETIIGAMLVIWVPMLSQSFIGDTQWLYTVLLVAEAIGIIGIGVGKRSRIQIYSGSALVSLAALRGAVLAYHSGVPIAVIIAGMALILLTAATWLSLRARANPAIM